MKTEEDRLADTLAMNFMEVTGVSSSSLALRYISYANYNVDEACLQYFRSPTIPGIDGF
jgi:hypothetical protein